MITTVLFDVDDTLIDWKKSAIICFESLFADINPDLSGKEIYTAFAAASAPLWEKVDRGEMTGNDLRKIRWNHVFAKLNIDRNDGESFEQEFRCHLAKAAVPIDGAEEILRYLAPKYTIGVASNAYFAQQNARLELLDFKKYLKHIFTSQEIGYEKPNVKFFEHCLKELGNPLPESVLMVGDNVLADVEGAKKAGFKTCWLNRDGKSTEGVPFDYHISSLKELMDIL